METYTTDIPKEYLVKLIENEIKTGFKFVAAARKAFLAAQYSDGNAALAQAEATHEEAAGMLDGGHLERIRAVNHQLSELRAAIDWLLTGFEPGEGRLV